MVDSVRTITARPITETDLANFAAGDTVYHRETTGTAKQWTVESSPHVRTNNDGETRISVPLTDHMQSSWGISSWTPWTFENWLIEDPTGLPYDVYELAGHVVQIRVVVPLDVAATPEAARDHAQSLAGEHGTAWSAAPYLDRAFHVFDDKAFPVAENLPESEIAGLGGQQRVGFVLFPGELDIRDCHRELVDSKNHVDPPRPGPLPKAELRAAVIDGHTRGLSLAQIASKANVSRQRIGQVVKTIRTRVANIDFTDVAPTPEVVDYARFAATDARTDPTQRAAAEDFLSRAETIAAAR